MTFMQNSPQNLSSSNNNKNNYLLPKENLQPEGHGKTQKDYYGEFYRYHYGQPLSLPKGHDFWKKRMKPSYSNEFFSLFFFYEKKEKNTLSDKKYHNNKKSPLFYRGFIIGRKIHKAHGRQKIKRRLKGVLRDFYHLFSPFIKSPPANPIISQDSSLSSKEKKILTSLSCFQEYTCCFVFLLKKKTFLHKPYKLLYEDLERIMMDLVVSLGKEQKHGKKSSQQSLQKTSSSSCSLEPSLKDSAEKNNFSSFGDTAPSSQQNPSFFSCKNPLTYGLSLLLWSFYRCCLAPFLSGSCRFSKTCSVYALETLRDKPFLQSLSLITKRLLRCHPWGPREDRDQV